MNLDNRNCLIARLIIVILALILAVVTAGLFAVGLIPALPTLFPFTAAIGAVTLALVFFAIIVPSPYESVRRCVICLGLLTFFAALAVLVLSLIATVTAIATVEVIGTIFVFVLALAFWIALIGLWQFARCLAVRCA